MGTKLTKKGNKKAHNSAALAGVELQALQSADADQHRDRITRFGLLKHRAKLQEQYLWTQVDFNLTHQAMNLLKLSRLQSN